MKKILFTLALSSLFFIGNFEAGTAQTTKQEKKEAKKEQKAEKGVLQAQKNIAKIETLNFTFYPNTVEPEFGVSRNIFSGNFYFTLDKTVMYMNLPYIGRFYITPMSPEDVPINITSSEFLYSVHTTDEINFHVTVIPSDVLNVMNQGIIFNFDLNKNNGSATLKVSANNRQDITYTGYYQ